MATGVSRGRSPVVHKKVLLPRAGGAGTGMRRVLAIAGVV